KLTGANSAIKTGQEIPSLTKTARMPDNPDSVNPVHEDEYAKLYDLRGALIGGPTLLSLVMEMLFLYFGPNWFYHGKIKTSFIGGGAIDGDELIAHGKITGVNSEREGTRVELDVWLENQKQEKIVVGQASCIK
ncbi:MAG: MaoC family dehydratase, partial [Deltaproteobacteria bacterium]|nr:MaoC family dehydratase [Deltaproteobacteria bacterium]